MGSFSVKWDVFVRSFIEKGAYRQVLEGLGNTMKIAIVGLIIGIVIGTLIAVIKIVPSKSKIVGVLKKIASLYVNFFRGTPIVVQLLLSYYVVFPLLDIHVSSLAVCIITFGFNSGAYVSEIMRSGILSVDYGQTEAGRAIGFSYGTTMLKIVVPQAIKNILPTLGNEFIALVKDTSIVSFVAATDLCLAFRDIGAANYEYMIPYLVMAVFYIVIVLIISGLIKIMERKMRASDKR